MSTFRQFLEKDQPDILSRIDEDILFEMANLSPQSTGVPYRIWLSGDPKTKHKLVRIKVEFEPGILWPVSIELQPRILVSSIKINPIHFKKVTEFIDVNRQVIEDYWYGKTDTKQMVAQIKSV